MVYVENELVESICIGYNHDSNSNWTSIALGLLFNKMTLRHNCTNWSINFSIF